MCDHYIGCLTDFPDCRCLRCGRDDCGFDEPCCLEHGHPCNSDAYCPDFIDENEGTVKRWLRRVLRKLFRRAEVVAPYEREGEEDV